MTGLWLICIIYTACKLSISWVTFAKKPGFLSTLARMWVYANIKMSNKPKSCSRYLVMVLVRWPPKECFFGCWRESTKKRTSWESVYAPLQECTEPRSSQPDRDSCFNGASVPGLFAPIMHMAGESDQDHTVWKVCPLMDDLLGGLDFSSMLQATSQMCLFGQAWHEWPEVTVGLLQRGCLVGLYKYLLLSFLTINVFVLCLCTYKN